MLTQSPLSISADLRRMAMRFTKSKTEAGRIAEQAFHVACADPTKLTGDDIETALFSIVHNLAQEQLGRIKAP